MVFTLINHARAPKNTGHATALQAGGIYFKLARMTQNAITRLQQYRLSAGLSAYQVAAATGIPRSTLRRMEAGTAPVLKRQYARALYLYYLGNVSLGDIYDPLFDWRASAIDNNKG